MHLWNLQKREAHKLFNLVKNEYLKIFYKKTTYVFLIICILLTVFIDFLFSTINSDDYFYEDTFEVYEEMHIISDDFQDKLTQKEIELYKALGFESYSDASYTWYETAVYNIVNNHLIFPYYMESDTYGTDYFYSPSDKELELRDISKDLDFAKRMEEALLADDYKKFFEISKEAASYNISMGYEQYSEHDLECYSYIIENDINPNEFSKFTMTFSEFISSKTDYDNMLETVKNGDYVSPLDIESITCRYMLNKHIVDNRVKHYILDGEDINEYTGNSFIFSMLHSSLICSVSGIFVIIIAAGIFSKEFSKGTIKFLLLNPVKRAKIFWSKYITCISLLIVCVAAFFGIHMVFSILFSGSDGTSGVFLSYADGQVQQESIILYSLKNYLLSIISVVTSVTLAFTISSLIKNSALAISLSFICEFLGSTIVGFLTLLKQDWARYLIFANTDLAGISSGSLLFAGQTLTFSLIVLAVYMIVFLLTAYDSFTKKNI